MSNFKERAFKITSDLQVSRLIDQLVREGYAGAKSDHLSNVAYIYTEEDGTISYDTVKMGGLCFSDSNIIYDAQEYLEQYGQQVPDKEVSSTTAGDFLTAALGHMQARAATYDSEGGERSMGKAVEAFNTITGYSLKESEGWLLLQLLKDVRQWSREGFHADSAEDCVAYAALKAESLLAEASPNIFKNKE